jgi:hypothetical protein
MGRPVPFPATVESEPMPSAAGKLLAEHMRKVPPAVRPTLEAAIKVVKDAAPHADEIAYQTQPPSSSRAMWKVVRYAVGGANVLGIGTFPTHANLFFYRGVELDDGSGLLQGGGKEMRSITLRVPVDAERPAVKRLVRKAFELGGTTSSAREAAARSAKRPTG